MAVVQITADDGNGVNLANGGQRISDINLEYLNMILRPHFHIQLLPIIVRKCWSPRKAHMYLKKKTHVVFIL